MDKQIEILEFIKNNFNRVNIKPQMYSNQLSISFSMGILPTKMIDNFPNLRLKVERISNIDIENNKDLVNFFFDNLSIKRSKDFVDVWLTTTCVLNKNTAFAEISFE